MGDQLQLIDAALCGGPVAIDLIAEFLPRLQLISID
jgi:hypothetical protein